MEVLAQLYRLLTPAERRQAAALLFGAWIGSLLVTLGVFSVFPFMALVADPSWLEGWSALDGGQWILVAGSATFLAITLGNLYSAWMTAQNFRFLAKVAERLELSLLRALLDRPYEDLTAANSADLAQEILGPASEVVQVAMRHLLQSAHLASTILLLVVLLVAADPWFFLFGGGGLAALYSVVFVVMKRWTERAGNELHEAHVRRLRTVLEAVGSPAEVRILGREEALVARHAASAHTFWRCNAHLSTASNVPRYVVDVMAFGVAILLVLYYVLVGRDPRTFLPEVALYVTAGHRLLHCSQQLYTGMMTFLYRRPSIEHISRTLSSLTAHPTAGGAAFEREFGLDGVTFQYRNATVPALREASLTVPRGTSLCLVGPTGAGKSTVMRLLAGLLRPQQGQVRVDGRELDASWLARIAFVPQEPFLLDDSLACNVTMGLPPHQTDRGRVRTALDQACLEPMSLATPLGDRGSSVSGGQAQRVGLARALYADREVLFLDEPTSALDRATADRVLREVLALGRTVVAISHRPESWPLFDRLCLIQEGRIAAVGTYDQLRDRLE